MFSPSTSRPRRNTSGAVLYNPWLESDDDCRCVDQSQYEALKLEVRNCAAIQHEELSTSVPLRFWSDQDGRAHINVGPTTYRLRRISDLPGVDRVLRPTSSRGLSAGQLRLYRYFTIFVMSVDMYFTPIFSCANWISETTRNNFDVTIAADRPVPLLREILPGDTRVQFKTEFSLSGRSGTSKLYHMTDTEGTRLSQMDDVVIYAG